MNLKQGLFQKTGYSAGISGRLERSGDPHRIQYEDELSQERVRDYSSSHMYDKLKAGFNVSYDSTSFQGIKNNLIQQTKAGQNMMPGKDINDSMTAGNNTSSHLHQAFNTNDVHGLMQTNGLNNSVLQNTSLRYPAGVNNSFLSPFQALPKNHDSEIKNSKF